MLCVENHIDSYKNSHGVFIFQPLEIGEGVTLGNALRRSLLSNLFAYSITGVRINNIKHEFSLLEGIREDVVEILLNLKNISFKANRRIHYDKIVGFLSAKGPTIVTAGMFNLPQTTLTLLNPSTYICTLANNTELYLEVDIEKGNHYKLKPEKEKEQLINPTFLPHAPNTLFVETNFAPVKKVHYRIKLIHDTQGNIKESLTLKILTNGSISPKRAIQESLKNLITLFSNQIS